MEIQIARQARSAPKTTPPIPTPAASPDDTLELDFAEPVELGGELVVVEFVVEVPAVAVPVVAVPVVKSPGGC
jgi:hypothetical protein